MKKTFSNKPIRATTLSLVFLLSAISGASLLNPAAAAPNTPVRAAPVAAASVSLSQAQANWEFPNGNAFAQDYNPQNQINSSNAQYLGLSWIYPLPTQPPSLNSLFLFGGSMGVDPLIVNGTAFLLTQFDEVIALNVANGNVLWTFQTPLAVNQTKGQAAGPVQLHTHDGVEWFTTATFGSGVSGPTMWFQGGNSRVYAINALTGKQDLNFTDYSGLAMVAGNSPTSVYSGAGASNIIINEKLGILVSGHGAETEAANGRGFFAGWDLNANPPTMKWITYSTPPQAGSAIGADPHWTVNQVNNMTGAYSFDPGKMGTNGYTTAAEIAGGVLQNTNDNIVVNWKSLSSTQLNASLYNDWGQADQSTQCQAIDGGMSTGTTGSGWGGSWLVGSGQTAGLAFVNTNNKDPYDSPCTPGPDLWSSSLLALNLTNGHWVWGFQATAHDLWDYDCSWYQGMGNATIAGVNTEIIIKTCKDGYLYELNAVTGDLIFAFSPPSGVITPGPSRCPVCYMWNPLNESQMNFDYPSAMTNCASGHFTQACVTGPQPGAFEWPSAIAGFEDEQAYDPATSQIYATSHIVPYLTEYIGLNSSSYFTSAGELFSAPCPQCGFIDNNFTTWDINAGTGQIMWHDTGQYQGYRGQTDVSGNIVYLTDSSGDVLMLNAATGATVRDYYLGAPMAIGLAIGASVNGQEYLLVPVGTCSLEAVTTCPGTTPGDIVALTLTGQPPSTSTSTTTVVSTSTTTSTTTAAGGGGGVTQTVTSTSVSVSVSTVSSSSNNTALYGVAAVAVIFIIVSGYLAMTRGKKTS